LRFTVSVGLIKFTVTPPLRVLCFVGFVRLCFFLFVVWDSRKSGGTRPVTQALVVSPVVFEKKSRVPQENLEIFLFSLLPAAGCGGDAVGGGCGCVR